MGKNNLMLSINRSKRGALKERTKELGVVPSVVTIYSILRFLDMLNGKRISNVDCNFIGLAFAEYKPYEYETDICYTCVSWSWVDITRRNLASQLSKHGFRLVPLCKAFYNTLLKCDGSSIPTLSTLDGFVLSSVSAQRVKSLKNRPFETELRLSEHAIQKLREIAKYNNTSIYSLISRTLEMVISLEYRHDIFIANSEALRDNILNYPKKISGIIGTTGYFFKTRGLERGVRILCLLEKYGIPGKSELLYRIVRFILLSHSGEISLELIRTDDDSDYIETRMVRNDFRKEVLYAAAR